MVGSHTNSFPEQVCIGGRPRHKAFKVFSVPQPEVAEEAQVEEHATGAAQQL